MEGRTRRRREGRGNGELVSEGKRGKLGE